MKRRAVVLGIGSDIGSEIAKRLLADDWTVRGYRRTEPYKLEAWDLLVVCYGTLEPIGMFWEVDADEWERGFEGNLFLPLRRVRNYYPYRKKDASVCFFSGAGTGGAAPTYSSYCASKIALIKMAELLDFESPDCKFFVLGPGVVRTKIHEQTIAAGAAAANVERVQSFTGDYGTSHDDIYECLKACVAAPKIAVGGRNIYVPLDDWRDLDQLKFHSEAFKLRRHSDEDFRRSLDSKVTPRSGTRQAAARKKANPRAR